MSFATLYSSWEGKRYREAVQSEEYIKAKQTPRSTSILAPPELRSQYYTPLRWCSLVTSALEEQVTVEDVQASSKAVTDWLRKTWRDLGGDKHSSQVHWGTGSNGRGYIAVTQDTQGAPRMVVLSAKSTVHRVNPETGELVEALRIYDEGKRATHYEIGRTSYYRKSTDGWARERTVSHGYPRLQIVVFAVQSEDGYGDPWARAIWGIQDAATRVSTDGSIAGALMAVPQRVILGADKTEQTAPAEKLYLARLLTLSKSDAKIEQFAAAQLQQFSTLLTMYARQAASTTGLPVQHFGITSEANPTSGDSKREDKDRITTRADRIARDLSPSWKSVLQLLLDFYPTPVSETVRASVRVIWSASSKPSAEAMGDLGVKLSSAQRRPGEPMFSRYFILKKMGLSEVEIQEELARVDVDVLSDMIGEGGDDGDPGAETDDK